MEYLIVGLGNPGEKYAHTRHNVGALCVEHVRKTCSFSDWHYDKACKTDRSEGNMVAQATTLIFPQDYMNNSGAVVKKILQKNSNFSVERLLVVHDDMDLSLGNMRLSHGRGSGGHRGVDSMHATLKSRAFVRLRIGISPREEDIIRKPQGEEAVLSFLMGALTEQEKQELSLVFAKCTRAIETWMREGVVRAMNVFN